MTIFLTINGVLNSDIWFDSIEHIMISRQVDMLYDESSPEFYTTQFDPACLEIMDFILRPNDSKVVIVTPNYFEVEMSEVLSVTNSGVLLDRLKDHLVILEKNVLDRSRVIADYISNHDIEEYMIITSDVFPISSPLRHVITIDKGLGIQRHQALEIRKLLENTKKD